MGGKERLKAGRVLNTGLGGFGFRVSGFRAGPGKATKVETSKEKILFQDLESFSCSSLFAVWGYRVQG